MEIPQYVVNKWQVVWQKICDMAYHRKDINAIVSVENSDYSELLKYMINAKNFNLITLEHMWAQASSARNADGTHAEVFVVPELREIYVPRILFETLGVYTWFKHSFPNCSILFWEDDM
jgi:hypothetical protein